MKNKIVIITGPTAIGKSSVAVELCQEFNGEVISADSMQIYKGMDIGTGKITVSEMRGIRHFMLDIMCPNDYFTAFDFVLRAKSDIEIINQNGKIPFIVGGTGLYISGLLSGSNFAETSKDDDVREKLEIMTQTNGLAYMHDYLKSVDPYSAEKISINDKKRILRALEIYLITGKPKSQSATVSKECEYDYLLFVIVPSSRELLYNEIEKRVDSMIEKGLVQEVEALYEYKLCNSMQAIGYKEIISFLDGEISLDKAISDIKQNSRRYAKRQLTYFRNMPFEKIFIEKNDNTAQVMSDIIRKIYG